MRLIGIGDNVCDVYLHLAEMFPGGQALMYVMCTFISRKCFREVRP